MFAFIWDSRSNSKITPRVGEVSAVNSYILLQINVSSEVRSILSMPPETRTQKQLQTVSKPFKLIMGDRVI